MEAKQNFQACSDFYIVCGYEKPIVRSFSSLDRDQLIKSEFMSSTCLRVNTSRSAEGILVVIRKVHLSNVAIQFDARRISFAVLM